MVARVLVMVGSLVTFACTVYRDDAPTGAEGGACYGNQTCNAGLTCLSSLCVVLPDAAIADAEPGPPDARLVDATDLTCNDDSALEPNDATRSAWITPIPDFAPSVALVSLAICPSTDRDLYRFRVDQNGKNLRATMPTNVPAGQLVLQLLNGAGATIANGNATSTSEMSLIVNNLAIGTYYVQVSAPAGVENNYALDIVTCDVIGCP